jgi:hypothetical protein
MPVLSFAAARPTKRGKVVKAVGIVVQGINVSREQPLLEGVRCFLGRRQPPGEPLTLPIGRDVCVVNKSMCREELPVIRRQVFSVGMRCSGSLKQKPKSSGQYVEITA